jgi:hypothetical protein
MNVQTCKRKILYEASQNNNAAEKNNDIRMKPLRTVHTKIAKQNGILPKEKGGIRQSKAYPSSRSIRKVPLKDKKI